MGDFVLKHRLSNRTALAMMAVFTLCIGNTACDDSERTTCCNEYFYRGAEEDTTAFSNNALTTTSYASRHAVYNNMCEFLTTLDDSYDRELSCNLKAVDSFIDAAKDCCYPLIAESMDYYLNEDLEAITLSQSYKNATTLFPVLNAMGPLAFQEVYPVNAYTWCVLNTNPTTFQCDLAGARAFEDSLRLCCGGDYVTDACYTNMVQSNGQCNLSPEEVCCNGLPEKDDISYISKDNCLAVYAAEKKCVKTPAEACCRNVRESSDKDELTRSICNDIFINERALCVNTDEKYEAYKNPIRR